MIRYLKNSIENDALQDFKMAFITGPRQVGKTTLAQSLILSEDANYFNWDEQGFKVDWTKSPINAVSKRGEGPIVLDEIHKDRRWKGRIKGLYDVVGNKVPIIVTGSARMDVFRKGGDSLMGRYIPYHLNPLSVGESEAPVSPDEVFQRIEPRYKWSDLMKLGAFRSRCLAEASRRLTAGGGCGWSGFCGRTYETCEIFPISMLLAFCSR